MYFRDFPPCLIETNLISKVISKQTTSAYLYDQDLAFCFCLELLFICFVNHRLSLETEEDKGTDFITAASDLVSNIHLFKIFTPLQ